MITGTTVDELERRNAQRGLIITLYLGVAVQVAPPRRAQLTTS